MGTLKKMFRIGKKAYRVVNKIQKAQEKREQEQEKQRYNEKLQDCVLLILRNDPTQKWRLVDIINTYLAFDINVTSQKLARVVSPLVANGLIKRIEEKGKIYFQAVV